MIVNTDNAFAIMDSLTDETPVRVYNAAEKLLTIGVVIKTFKNGFRVKNASGWADAGDETTFFYRDALTVVAA